MKDEGRFGRINHVRACWVPPKTRAVVGKQIVREYTHAYCALCPESGENFSLILPHSDSECMGIFMDGLSQRYSAYRIILVLDRAGNHHPDIVKGKENIVVLPLPPRSPELNPVEHIWDYIREQKKFNNHTFESMERLEAHLSSVLSSLEKEKSINVRFVYSAGLKMLFDNGLVLYQTAIKIIFYNSVKCRKYLSLTHLLQFEKLIYWHAKSYNMEKSCWHYILQVLAAYISVKLGGILIPTAFNTL